jgi:hypothetical protein
MKPLHFFSLLAAFFSCFQSVPVNGNNNAHKSSQIISVGSRLELFTDDYLVDSVTGEACFRLHHPIPKELVITYNQPWEGSACGYYSIFHDGEKYRMYYKAAHYDGSGNANSTHPSFCAYAESFVELPGTGRTWTS